MKSLTLRHKLARYVLAGLALVATTVVSAGNVSAQCANCPAPTVAYQPVTAYQPVVAQPTVANRPYRGWYPGKLIDQWRSRRAGVSAAALVYAPTYAAAYAPASYSAAYAPVYSAAYAPTYTAAYAAAYRPYVTSFAPLSTPAVVQTVARQVVMSPVYAAPGCSTCSFTPSCGCDACSTGVSQAAYAESYSEPACSGCAGGSVSSVAPSAGSLGPNVGPQTPPPSLSPVPAPDRSQYESNRPLEGSGSRETEKPADVDPLDQFDPSPTSGADPSTYNSAPRLLGPRDRTARSYKETHKPTVDVWTAVYRQPANNSNISQTNSRVRTQAEIDADGWAAVPNNR